MPYVVELPDGREVEFPDSVSREQASAIIRKQFYSQQAAPQEESGILRQAADVPVQVASGLASGVRMIADSFGADNPVSKNIRGVENYLQGLLSAQSKNDQQEIARIMKDAEDKGLTEQVLAGLKAFTVAPVDLLAQAAGTAAPAIAGGLAAQALKASAALASTGVGAVMGAGTIKSSIYDEVKNTLTQMGATEEEAEQRAVLAQEYGGENLDQILLGTVIGGATGRFGIESSAAKALAGEITKKTVLKEGSQQVLEQGAKPILRAAAEEAVPEALQAGQEQVAQNIALQREGVDVPTFRGAVGAGTLEALAGAGLGGVGEVAARRLGTREEVQTEVPPETEEEVDETQVEAPPVAPPAPPETVVEPPEEEPAPAEPALTREQLLTEMEEVAPPTKEELEAKTAAAMEPANLLLNIARAKVQESGKTAAPYIQNVVNAYKPGEIQNVTLEEAKKIRQQLVNEGIITGKDQVKKVEVGAPISPLGQSKTVTSKVRPKPDGQYEVEPVDSDEYLDTEPLTFTAPTATTTTAPEETVIDYDALEAEQNRALQESLAKVGTEEKTDVSATTGLAAVKTKPAGRGKRAAVSVSTEKPGAADTTTPATLTDGVGLVTNTSERPSSGEGDVAPALEANVVETPQDRYDSIVRRVEGLSNARRAPPIIINRLRTQLKQGDPTKNPDGYENILTQADEIVSKFEEAAEAFEADQSGRGLDLREQRLKAQEGVALDRAQQQIEQDKIADSLRSTYERKLSDEELLPDYALKMRDILESTGNLNTVTRILADTRLKRNTAAKDVPMAAYRPAFLAVARKLSDIDFRNVNVQTEKTPNANLEVFKRLKQENKEAEFDPADNTLYIRRDKINGFLIQHELVHAGTVQTIRQYEIDGFAGRVAEAQERLAKATKKEDKEAAQRSLDEIELQKVGVQRLQDVYKFAQEQTSDVSLAREYARAFENLYEFIAGGMSSPMFQSRLARIEVPTPVGRKNLWTEFVKAISNIFGFKPKHKGGVSVLDELGQAFSEIVAAPKKEGITGVSPLASTAEPGKIKKPKKAEEKPKQIDPIAESEKKLLAMQSDKLTFRGLLKHLVSLENVQEAIRKYQDQLYPIRALQRDMDRADLLNWSTGKDGGNALAAANDMSAGLYDNYEKVVTPLIEGVNKAVAAYQAVTGRDYTKAMARLGAFFTAETSDQRRLMNYIKEKPLSTKLTVKLKGSDKYISYAQLRDMLLDSVQTTQVLDDAARNAIYNRLLQLAGIEIGPNGRPQKSADADKYADPLGASYGQLDRKGEARKPGKRTTTEGWDYEDPYYDIIEDWDYGTNNNVLKMMAEEMKTHGKEIKAVRQALIELDKVTQQFNAEANHLTQPAKNLIKLYGWDKYVPLMGKLKSSVEKKEQFIYINKVPNEFLPGARGRKDAPDNPILMTIVNAGKAATRAARADIVPTLVNLIKENPKSGKQYVKGEIVGTIKFNDRYKGEVNFEETDGAGKKKWVGKDKFYNYLDNGDIEVWRVGNEQIIEALRPEWVPPKGLSGRTLSALQTITSVIGQGHTRYQPKFAIYDFPRNLFANAGAIYSELGRENAAKYMASVGNEVFVKLRIPQVWRIASAHYNGDFATIKKIGGFDEKTGEWKDPFVREAYQYLERGGRVSIVRSWQTRGKLEELIEEAEKSDIRKNAEKYKESADKIFDLWMDGFELVARVQGFRVAKSHAINKKKMSPEQSELYALSFAKNLANFEKRAGSREGKWASALYAFFAPSATGAVRAFEAIMPAFRNIETVVDELPPEIKNDPQAKARYIENYKELKQNAKGAMAVYASFGFMAYMMALSVGAVVKGAMDDEEDPKNPVAEDSKELWTRNLRIPLDWLDLPALKDKYFQIPWGFGLGAFGAAGAQVAAVVTNGQSLKQFTGNMASIAVDSYMPLPFARFNPLDSPFNFLISSLMPSSIRPFYEHNVNMSGLGQPIYRDYYNRYGPAYAGSENIEEFYRKLADYLNVGTDGRVQYEPNEIRFFMTAYLDGVASFVSDGVGIGLTLQGSKDFDPKTDLIFLDSYIGNKISPAVIDFNKARTRLDVLKRGYDTAINSPNPALRESFLRKYPNAPGIVAMYNKQVAALRQFQQQTSAGVVYADTPKERKDFKKEMNKIRDVYMDQVSGLYETYEEDIDKYYQFWLPI
jgi:hypothetical protein